MRSSIIVSAFVLGAFASPRASFANVLERRQSSSNPYPPECNGACSPVEAALNSCSDDRCFCTSSNIQAFAQCLQCTVNSIGQRQELQSTLTEVVNDCNSEGFKVPSETLTGGSGGSVPTGGSAPTDTFFSPPAGPTASSPIGQSSGLSSPTGNGGGGLNPTPTNDIPPITTSASGGDNNNGNGLPSFGGGAGGALSMGVSHAFVGTILAGVGLAIAAL